MLEEQEARYHMGLGLCIDAGAIDQCEFHEGTYFEGHEDVEAAYRLANARISSGALRLGEGETRRDVTDAIKEAYEDNAGMSSCARCDDIMRRD